MTRLIAVLLGLFLAAAPMGLPSANAVQPDEVLADPALERRARDLSEGLRCMVCQNQSIDESDAPLARDLRLLVRERLVAGDSDQEVQDYLVSRYGEFVLMRPRFSLSTLALWGFPLLILLAGACFVIVNARSRKVAAPAALTTDEERRIAELLERREKG